MTISHVLIARTDNIGDVVLTLPLAGYIKQQWPKARIGFIVRSYAADLVRQCRAVDDVYESDRFTDPVADLRAIGAGIIIFAKPDRVLAKAAKEAGIVQRVGTSHRPFHWFTCNRLAHFSRVRSNLHEAQLNFALLRPLGIKFIPALDEIPALYQLEPPPYDGPVPLPADQFHLVIHPKSNGNGREWPIAHFTALAQELSSLPDVRLYVTGSPAEGRWLEEHAAELLEQPNVINTCGCFSLGQLGAFMCAADGLIASGTGPLHMAAGFGQRTLGLFPPVKPIHPGRWAPLGARAQYLCEAQECAGCKDADTCRCMLAITPERVAAFVRTWRDEKAAA